MSWLDDRAALARSREASLAAARAWRDGTVQRLLERRFAVAGTTAESIAAVAERLLRHDRWVARLLAPLAAALRDDPAFEPPLRIQRDALRTGCILHQGDQVTVTASVLSADALAGMPPPATVIVAGRLSVVRYVRGGGARLSRWCAEPVDDRFVAARAGRCVALAAAPLADGMVLRQDGRTRAFRIEGARTDVVTVTASIRAGAAPLMREFDLATGALLRTATLDEGASRTQMLLTLLRIEGRGDARACFAAATRDRGFHLRWSAMREWLALDAEAALPRLREMAATDPHPEVLAAARTTLAMLERRTVPCPA